MAVKPILDIDVNDAKFKNFQALFDKYQTQLGKMPGTWASVGKEAKGARGSFEAVAAALMAQNEMSRRVAKSEKEAASAAKSQALTWRGMARSTREVAGNIASATKQLLKWTALTSVFTGLLGAGGLFGIDRMALNVGAGRRSAMGLGTSYGEEKSFGLNFGRFVDPGRVLGSVSEALADPTKQTAFATLGMTRAEMSGGTASTAVNVLEHVKRWVDKADPRTMGTMANAMRLGDLGFGLEDLRRLKATSPAEFAAQRSAYGRDVGTLGLGANTQKAWQDFATQMSRAGTQIENVFVLGLTPLIEPLTRLSGALGNVVGNFLGSKSIKEDLDAVGRSLNRFASYVGTPEFANNVRTFAEGLGVLAAKFGWVISAFAPRDPNEPPPAPNLRTKDPLDSIIGPWTTRTAPDGTTTPGSLFDFLRNKSAAPGTTPPVTIKIENAPGNSAVVSGSQVAH